jgi:indolepyruvate ferredoxin oxidoreductase, beta subunit
MKQHQNILIAGVGGQGNLVCGKTLAQAAVEEGYKPVVGQIFGASRRGGTVQTHVRISDSNLGPLIPRGDVHIILGLEPMETLRAAIEYAGPETIALMSETPVQTVDSLAGRKLYPRLDELQGSLSALARRVYSVDPTETLEDLGTYRVQNSYMLGALCGIQTAGLSKESIKTGLIEIVGRSQPNTEAFEEGLKAGRCAVSE